jgi:hypothetical protein
VARPERRRIRQELRASLADAAEDFGVARAVEQFGDPQDVAGDYLAGAQPEGRAGGFRPAQALAAAAVTLLVLVVLQVVRIPSFGIDADPALGSTGWQWRIPHVATFAGDLEEGTLFDVTVYRIGYVVVPALVFAALCWQPRRVRRGWVLLGAAAAVGVVVALTDERKQIYSSANGQHGSAAGGLATPETNSDLSDNRPAYPGRRADGHQGGFQRGGVGGPAQGRHGRRHARLDR